MIETHFGFSSDPFSLTADSSIFYRSHQHVLAEKFLQYAIDSKGPFALLTGEVGCGKSLLVSRLLTNLGNDIVVVLCNRPYSQLDSLRGILTRAIGITPGNVANIDVYEDLLKTFEERYAQGKRTLLVVDESQNLSVEALEDLRLLSNANPKDTFLQILLVGQTELRAKLHRTELRQFEQRISAQFHLKPLPLEETRSYIAYRLQAAGGAADLFTSDAVDFVFQHTGGVPRLINQLCNYALVQAASSEAKRVDLDVMAAMAQEFRGGLAFQFDAKPDRAPEAAGTVAPFVPTPTEAAGAEPTQPVEPVTTEPAAPVVAIAEESAPPEPTPDVAASAATPVVLAPDASAQVTPAPAVPAPIALVDAAAGEHSGAALSDVRQPARYPRSNRRSLAAAAAILAAVAFIALVAWQSHRSSSPTTATAATAATPATSTSAAPAPAAAAPAGAVSPSPSLPAPAVAAVQPDVPPPTPASPPATPPVAVKPRSTTAQTASPVRASRLVRRANEHLDNDDPDTAERLMMRAGAAGARPQDLANLKADIASQKLDIRLASAAREVRAAIATDSLLAPAADSAEAEYEQMSNISANDPQTVRVRHDLQHALLAHVRDATASGDFDTARRYLDAAKRMGTSAKITLAEEQLRQRMDGAASARGSNSSIATGSAADPASAPGASPRE